ncbi:hypothetical protein ANCDUO_12942 [Ancylostoma duodenale]|uniref:Uncharacterized protein n=1 Tax=Ancylostoma duodenale TaxID=51022 RepID=A0A0C2G7H5_9BILA|nr:hypothetical protein ANCDUO_12942 [Ancylostoma duodenale]
MQILRTSEPRNATKSQAEAALNGIAMSNVPGPAVMSTAVIARSSSAPRLQTYKAEDDIAVGEIRRFWPPLRSLETLHDNISFEEFDRFLAHLLTARTPLPSPPKTPLPAIEGCHLPEANLKALRDEVERLKELGINDINVISEPVMTYFQRFDWLNLITPA